jgi:peptidoglycan-associated lipoprotein
MKNLIAIIAVLVLANCIPKPQHKVVTEEAPKPVAEQVAKASFEGTVYFAYDSAALSAQVSDALLENIRHLKEEGYGKILIEGHADARGTKEYNLALGERRAQAVKNFLVRNGVKAKKVKIVSYGEEKPAAYGASERSYRLNRRAEIVLK